MRIAFLIDRWQPGRGGAEGALALLASHLEEQGHQVLAFGCRGPARYEAAPGTFHQVRTWGLTRSGRERRLGQNLVQAAAAEKCQLTLGIRHLPRVDLYWPHGGSHLASWQAQRRARGKPEPGTPGGRHRTFIDLERGLLAHGGARRIVALSPLVEQELLSLYPECRERLVLIPNGIDLARFTPARRDQEGQALRNRLTPPLSCPLLTFPATNPLLKGLAPLTLALARLLDRPWHLLAAGAPWGRFRRHLGQLPRERFTHLDRADSLSLASASDLLVLPVWRGPCELTILEALACGTPVITTALAGASDRITTPVAGQVLPQPDRVPELARAITAQLDRPPLEKQHRVQLHQELSDLDQRIWLERLEQELLSLL